MSEQYTISAVSERTRDYGEGAKAKRVYYVRLNEAQPKDGVQAFELHKLQTSKPPEAGHKLDVKTFQEGEFGGQPFVKIITDFNAGRAGSSGGYSGGGSDDARGESIERQVAAKVAGEMAASTPPGQAGAVAMAANFEGFFDAVLAKIKGTGETRLNGGGGEVPADTVGLGASPSAGYVTPDDQIKF